MTKSLQRAVIVVVVLACTFSLCPSSFGASKVTVCSLTKKADHFSWSNCYGIMFGHDKYCYCRVCDGLVLYQEKFTSCDSSVVIEANGYRDTLCSVCRKIMSSVKLPDPVVTPVVEPVYKDSYKEGRGSLSYTFNDSCASCHFEMEMWHYSGGYWKIGNILNETETVRDSLLGALINVENHLNNNYQNLNCVIPYPSGFTKDNCLITTNSLNANCVSISSSTLSNDGAHISLRLNYNLNKQYSMDDYVTALSKDIPILNTSYGNNVYAIYGNNISAAEGLGRFDDPKVLTAPYIHPVQIKNNSGVIKDGHRILINESIYNSNGFSIGLNTFKNAGAVGLRFSFPFTVSFTKKEEPKTQEEKKETEEPSGGGSTEETPVKPPVTPNPPVVPSTPTVVPDTPSANPPSDDKRTGGKLHKRF